MDITWGISTAIFIAAAAAAASGTGGGALYMPVYMFASSDAHIAVPLSKATILGLATATFCLNVSSFHPYSKQKSFIDIPVAALIETPTLLGAFAGIILNLLLPSFVLLIFLIFCLSITVYKTFKKAIELHAKEKEQAESASLNLLMQPLSEQSSYKDSELAPTKPDHNIELYYVNADISVPTYTRIKQFLMDSENTEDIRRLRIVAFAFLVINWAVNWVGLFLCKGPAAIICGNFKQRLISWLLIIFHVACISFYQIFLRHFYKRRHDRGVIELPTSQEGYQWLENPYRTFAYSMGGSLAGFCAGSLGIGGGLVKGPLMLQMGLNPLSAISTATFMLLFTSSTTTLSFAVADRLLPSTALFLGFIAFLGGLIGTYFIHWLIKKYKFQSYVTFFIAGVVLISMICMIICTTINQNSPYSKLVVNDFSKNACEVFIERNSKK